jgi:hypothetical protein
VILQQSDNQSSAGTVAEASLLHVRTHSLGFVCVLSSFTARSDAPLTHSYQGLHLSGTTATAAARSTAAIEQPIAAAAVAAACNIVI